MEHRCFIELGTKTLTSEQMKKVEDICNDLIRQGVSMTPHWCDPGSPEMEQVRVGAWWGLEEHGALLVCPGMREGPWCLAGVSWNEGALLVCPERPYWSTGHEILVDSLCWNT
jgi:hypothetical protein